MIGKNDAILYGWIPCSVILDFNPRKEPYLIWWHEWTFILG